MENLACMSATTCPGCWRFQGGRCALLAQLREEFAPMPYATAPLLPLATA